MHSQYSQARNLYFQEIKLAKTTSWNDFLENADSEQVFKAYKYYKQRKLEKTPIIYCNNQKAITFDEKCKIFLNTLLSANSANMTASANLAYMTINNINLNNLFSANLNEK